MESLLASTILAMACSSVILPFSIANNNQQIDLRRNVAVVLGQELMEEILSKPFNDPQGSSVPGPEAGETSRTLFDNIDDYHGFSDGYNQNEPLIKSISGEVFSESSADKLSRWVTVEYVYVDGQDASDPANFVRIQVAVNYLNMEELKLTRLVYLGD